MALEYHELLVRKRDLKSSHHSLDTMNVGFGSGLVEGTVIQPHTFNMHIISARPVTVGKTELAVKATKLGSSVSTTHGTLSQEGKEGRGICFVGPKTYANHPSEKFMSLTRGMSSVQQYEHARYVPRWLRYELSTFARRSPCRSDLSSSAARAATGWTGPIRGTRKAFSKCKPTSSSIFRPVARHTRVLPTYGSHPNLLMTCLQRECSA